MICLKIKLMYKICLPLPFVVVINLQKRFMNAILGATFVNCWPHNIDLLMKFGDPISEAASICCCALDCGEDRTNI